MSKRLGWLTGGTLAFWVVVVYPANLWWGRPAVVYSAVALALCLVPTAATLLWSERALKGSPADQRLLVLGGTAVRMLLVLGVGLALSLSLVYFRQPSFWLWVLVFYLWTLTLEIGLMLAAQSAAGNP